uniref:Uncharacterized protein n=1 Tax=Oryza sativa subsp. japonica TaxID=39947 RepID=Q8W334_ORYSJ|nr:hypothetical protein [Oryza sativa Japonica Group]
MDSGPEMHWLLLHQSLFDFEEAGDNPNFNEEPTKGDGGWEGEVTSTIDAFQPAGEVGQQYRRWHGSRSH